MNTKIALVTGGRRGLGKNTALAKKGVDVIITYHSKKTEANEVVAEIEKYGQKAIALQLNVANSQSFADFAAQIITALKQKWNSDPFDFLINNTGSGVNTSFMETTDEQFDQMVNIHLKGVFFLTQKLLPLMTDGGHIVNVSSELTRYAIPSFTAYTTMKGGVETLTKYLANELGARKITVNVVAPGAIETDFGGGTVRDNAQMNSFIASQTALGRVGLPDDIGGVIASLLSEDNRWVNAQRIEASGGMYI